MNYNTVKLESLESWLARLRSNNPCVADDTVVLKPDGSFDVQTPGCVHGSSAEGPKAFFRYIHVKINDNLKILSKFVKDNDLCQRGKSLKDYEITLYQCAQNGGVQEIKVSLAKVLVESLMSLPSKKVNQLIDEFLDLMLMSAEEPDINRKLEELYNYLCKYHAMPREYRRIRASGIYEILLILSERARKYIEAHDLFHPNQLAAANRVNDFLKDKEIDLAILRLSEVNREFQDPANRSTLVELLEESDDMARRIILASEKDNDILKRFLERANPLIKQEKSQVAGVQAATTEKRQSPPSETPASPSGAAQAENASVRTLYHDVTSSSSGQKKHASAASHTPISGQSSSGTSPTSPKSSSDAEADFSSERSPLRVLDSDSQQLRSVLQNLSIDPAKHDQIIEIKPDSMNARALDHTLKYEIGLDDNSARLILEVLKSPNEIDALMNARQKEKEEDQARRNPEIALTNRARIKEKWTDKSNCENSASFAIDSNRQDIMNPERDVLVISLQTDDFIRSRFDECRTVFANKVGYSDLNGKMHEIIDQIPPGKKFKEIHFIRLPGYEFNDEAANLLLFQKVNRLMEDQGQIHVKFGIGEHDYNDVSFMNRVLKPAGFGQLVTRRDNPGSIGVHLSANKVRTIEAPPLKVAEPPNVNTFPVVEPVPARSQTAKAEISQTPASDSGSHPLQKIWISKKEQIKCIMKGNSNFVDHQLIEQALQNPGSDEFNLTPGQWAVLKVKYEEWQKNRHHSNLPPAQNIPDYMSRVKKEKQWITDHLSGSSASAHRPIAAETGTRTFSHVTPPYTKSVDFPESSFETNAGQVGVSDGGAPRAFVLSRGLNQNLSLPRPAGRNPEMVRGNARPFSCGRMPAMYSQKHVLSGLSSPPSSKAALLRNSEASEDVINGADVATRWGPSRPEPGRSDRYDKLMPDLLSNNEADRIDPSTGTLVPGQDTDVRSSSTTAVIPAHELSADDQKNIRLIIQHSAEKLSYAEAKDAVLLGMDLTDALFLSSMPTRFRTRQLNVNRRNNSGQQDAVVARNTRTDSSPSLDSITILKAMPDTEDTRTKILSTRAQHHQNIFRERLQDILNHLRPTAGSLLPADNVTSSLAAVLQESTVENFSRLEEQLVRELSTAPYPVTVHNDGRVVLQIAAGIQAEGNNCVMAAVLMALSYRGSLELVIHEGEQLISALNSQHHLLTPRMRQQLDRLVKLVKVLDIYNEEDQTILRTNDGLNEIRKIFGLPQGEILDADECIEKIITVYRDLRPYANVRSGFDVFNIPGEDMEEYSRMSTHEAFEKYYYREHVREIGNIHVNSCAITTVLAMLGQNPSLSTAMQTQQKPINQSTLANSKSGEHKKAHIRTNLLLPLMRRIIEEANNNQLLERTIQSIKSTYNLDPTSILCPFELLKQIIHDLNLLAPSSSASLPHHDEFVVECNRLYQRALFEEIKKHNQSKTVAGKTKLVINPDLLVISVPSFGTENRVNMKISHEMEKSGDPDSPDRYRLSSVISISSGHYVAWMYDHEQKQLITADSMSEQLGVDGNRVVVPGVLSMPMEDTSSALMETVRTMNKRFDSPVKDAMTRFEKLQSTFRLAFYRKV